MSAQAAQPTRVTVWQEQRQGKLMGTTCHPKTRVAGERHGAAPGGRLQQGVRVAHAAGRLDQDHQEGGTCRQVRRRLAPLQLGGQSPRLTPRAPASAPSGPHRGQRHGRRSVAWSGSPIGLTRTSSCPRATSGSAGSIIGRAAAR